MLSFCTVARDTPNLKDLIDLFKEKWGGEYEICIGDNSTKPEFTELYKELADVYVRIEDKEFFRMGIPGHIIELLRKLILIRYFIWIQMNIQYGLILILMKY